MVSRLVPVAGGSPITLDKPIVLIGRHPECDAVLQQSTKVSRRHCCVAQVNNRYLIRDLGSMNGVRINGNRVSESELNPGDEIAIGDQFFILRQEEAVSRKGREKAPADLPANARAGVRMSLPPAPPQRPVELSQEYPVPISDEDDEAPLPALSESGYHGHGDIEDIPLKD